MGKHARAFAAGGAEAQVMGGEVGRQGEAAFQRPTIQSDKSLSQ